MPDASRFEAKRRRQRRALSRKRKHPAATGTQGESTRTSRRLTNAHRAWLHRISCKLAERAGTIVIGTLNTRAMTWSARGTRETPGTNVSAKAGRIREILNTGWPAMEQMFSYRAVKMVRVPAAFASRSCSACDVIDADSRRSQASFKCEVRGHAQNADLNAARRLDAGVGDWRVCTAKSNAIGYSDDRETDSEGPRHSHGQVPLITHLAKRVSRDRRYRNRHGHGQVRIRRYSVAASLAC